MDKRSVMLFIRKYRILLGILSFVFIGLPQYIDALWSLSEHISTEESSMSVTWLYLITVPLGLGMLLVIAWLSKQPIPERSVALCEPDKSKITAMMETVNALNDRMDRYVDESIYHEGDRIAYYQSLIDSSEFRGLWDKYSTQSAQVIVISPELNELVWNMLRLTQSHHRYFLREWYMNQVTQLSRESNKHINAIMIFRKRIQQVLEQLIDGN